MNNSLGNKQVTRNQRWIKQLFRDTNSDASTWPAILLLNTYWKERILNAAKIFEQRLSQTSIILGNRRRGLLRYSLKDEWNFNMQEMARKGISEEVNFNFIHSFMFSFIKYVSACLYHQLLLDHSEVKNNTKNLSGLKKKKKKMYFLLTVNVSLHLPLPSLFLSLFTLPKPCSSLEDQSWQGSLSLGLINLMEGGGTKTVADPGNTQYLL